MTTITRGDDYAGAVFSADERYRYALWRRWQDGERGRVLFVMLNPSRADHEINDATIRRCRGYAKSWHYDGLAVVNLYAYRATDPAELSRVADPIGPENLTFLESWARTAPLIVCAWGAHGADLGREVAPRLAEWSGQTLYALDFTAAGAPRHPLRLPAYLRPCVWSVA